MQPPRPGLLEGAATTGFWNSISVDRPTILHPTWSPNNTNSQASLDIIVTPTFIPQLYYVPQEGRGAAPFGVAPLNLFDVTPSSGPGILYFPEAGEYWVNNPNPSTLPVPYVLLDASDPVEARRLLRRWAPHANSGTRSAVDVITVDNVAPYTIALWDVFRTRLQLQVIANPGLTSITASGATPTTTPNNGRLMSLTLDQWESPVPWAFHQGLSSNNTGQINAFSVTR